ncbi:hypothetical protein GQ457_06G023410 [Hibiscus cannabinus]
MAELQDLIGTGRDALPNYWSSQLIIPGTVISRINQLCVRFFWKGEDNNKGRKVKLILLKDGSIWVAWIGSYNLVCAVVRTQELEWAHNRLKGKSLCPALLKLARNCYIYLIWRERNSRLFQGSNTTVLELVKHAKENVKIKLSGKTN